MAVPTKTRLDMVRPKRPRSKLDQVTLKGLTASKFNSPFKHLMTGELLPPLTKFVADKYLWGETRAEILPLAQAAYGCSVKELDLCIRKAKDDWLEYLERTTTARNAKRVARMDRVARAAYNVGDYNAARLAEMDAAKLCKDLPSDKITILNGNQSPEELLEAAEAMRKLAEESSEG